MPSHYILKPAWERITHVALRGHEPYLGQVFETSGRIDVAGAPTPTSTPRTAGLTPDVLRLLRAGAEQHERGRLREAEAIYKDALAAAPYNPEVLHLVGLVSYQLGRPHDAVAHLERAVAADGLVAAYHDNLGLALRAVGRLEEAAIAHRQAAVLDRHTPEIGRAHV